MIQPRLYSGPTYKGLRIGLLGGSFNPAHAAHLAMSLHALRRLKLDQIWWLVSPQNPLKPVRGMAPFNERMEQARRLANRPKIKATDLETQLGTRYTIDTLRALKRRFPGARFVWLMGADNLKQIPQWKKWPEIFGSVPVAVFRRSAYAAGQGLSAGSNRGSGKAMQRFRRYGLPAGRFAKQASSKAPAWTVLDNRLNDLSATEIRRELAREKEKRG